MLVGQGLITPACHTVAKASVLAATLSINTVIILVLPTDGAPRVFAVDGAWTLRSCHHEYTLDNYRRLITDAQLWKRRNSVSMALIATVANVIVCFVAAYLTSCATSADADPRASCRTALGNPATAIALGLAATFNKNIRHLVRVLLVGTF